MKNLKLILLVFITSFLFTGCAKFHDGGSVWSGGLFIIPWVTGLASLFFGYLTYKEWKKGGTGGYVNKNGVPVWTEDEEKFAIYKASFFWFSVILAAATIGIIIGVNGSK